MQLIKPSLADDAIKLPFTAARVSIVATASVILLLAALHFLSPELDPAWRMVSEYALGHYGWVLSLMFISWAVGSWALAVALWDQVKTTGGKVGLMFLIASGVGEAMAAAFDVKHGLHGAAALIGMPSLPIAAVLISLSLSRNEAWLAVKKVLLGAALLTCVSIILMTVAVIVMFNGLSRTGGVMNSEVLALNGYANRFLIASYCVWIATAARGALHVASPPVKG